MNGLLQRNKWQVWKDVIFSLMVREIKTGFNDKLGLSWAVINPVIFIFVLSFVRGRLDGGETYTLPTFVFMAFGLILIQLFLQAFQSCANSIKQSKPLFAFRQVQPISPVIAAGLFELVIKLFVIVCIGVVMYFLQMQVRLDDPLLFMRCILAVSIIAFAGGLIFGCLAMFVPEVMKLQNLLTRPLFFISGVFFSLRDFPRDLWWLLDWNPLLHAIELSRYAGQNSYGSVGVSEQFLWSVALGALFFAMLLYRASWRKGISR